MNPVWLLLLAAPTVRVEPPKLVLGADDKATISVQSGEAPRRAANVGALDQSGEVLVYTPPPEKWPQTALLAFWADDPEEAPPEVTVVRLPLLGRLDLPVTTDPGATVRVEVAGKSFGPVVADANGAATVSIEVPPGVVTANVFAERNGQKTQRSATIDVPPPSPPLALLSPDPMHPDRGGWLVVFTPEGNEPRPEAEGASLDPRGRFGDGWLYAVRPASGVQTVRIRAQGRPVEARVSQEVATPMGQLGRLTPQVEGWASFGGSATGLAASAGAGYRMRGLAERVHLEAALGTRQASAQGQTLTGRTRSEVHAIPAGLSARVRVWSRGMWNGWARAGTGLIFFQHRTEAEGQPVFWEAGISYEAFAAFQLSLRRGSFEAFAELRGLLSPIKTARIDVDTSGLALGLGVRYALP